MATKKEYKEFQKRIRDMVLSMGAIPYYRGEGGMFRWTIPVTRLGPLHVTVHDSDFSVFARFEYPEIAVKEADCNPYTGKWNFHIDGNDGSYICDYVKMRIESLLVRQSDLDEEGFYKGDQK